MLTFLEKRCSTISAVALSYVSSVQIADFTVEVLYMRCTVNAGGMTSLYKIQPQNPKPAQSKGANESMAQILTSLPKWKQQVHEGFGIVVVEPWLV